MSCQLVSNVLLVSVKPKEILFPRVVFNCLASAICLSAIL